MLSVDDRTEEIFDRYLDGDFFVAGAGEFPATKEDFTAITREFGCKFPRDFLAHSMGRFGGAYVEVKEDVWPRPKRYDVGPFWSFLYAFFVYGLGKDVPDWMNMRIAAEKFRESTGHRGVVPCLKRVGDADMFLFDAAGRLVQWRHETDEFEVQDGSFFDLLETEVRELRERKDKKVSGSES